MKDTIYFYSTNIQTGKENNMLKLTFQQKQTVDFVIQDVYFTFPDAETQVDHIYSKFNPVSQFLHLHFTVRNRGTADSGYVAAVNLFIDIDGKYEKVTDTSTANIGALKAGEQQISSIQIYSETVPAGMRKFKLVLTTNDANIQYSTNNEVTVEVLAQSATVAAASLQE